MHLHDIIRLSATAYCCNHLASAIPSCHVKAIYIIAQAEYISGVASSLTGCLCLCKVLGPDLARGAAVSVAAVTNSTVPQPGGSSDAISNTLGAMSRADLYEIMSQMKALVEQNPAQARQILVQNPQLTKALFQAQIMLGMIKGVTTTPVCPLSAGSSVSRNCC